VFLQKHNPKIGDFGWSTIKGNKSIRKPQVGEQYHMPPESFDDEYI